MGPRAGLDGGRKPRLHRDPLGVLFYTICIHDKIYYRIYRIVGSSAEVKDRVMPYLYSLFGLHGLCLGRTLPFLYVYIEGSPIEIQTQAHWNLIGCSMIAPSLVIAQQYSSATRLKSFTISTSSAFFFNCVILRLRNSRMRKWGSVCFQNGIQINK